MVVVQNQSQFWHKFSMEKEIIPYSGVDINAKGGFIHTKGCVMYHQGGTGKVMTRSCRLHFIKTIINKSMMITYGIFHSIFK